MACSLGGRQQSPKRALLIALVALWQRYLSQNSGDQEATTYLQRLQNEMEVPED